jgi:hypothetical protein
VSWRARARRCLRWRSALRSTFCRRFFCSLNCCFCYLRRSICRFSGDFSSGGPCRGAAAAAVAAAAASVILAAAASVPVTVEGAARASAPGVPASSAVAAMAATGEGLRAWSSASRMLEHWKLAEALVSARAYERSCVIFQSNHVEPHLPDL